MLGNQLTVFGGLQQDAVTRPMLEKSVARAVESADRKVNLVMSAISSLEERMEFLTNSKADLDVVAMKAELEHATSRMRSAIDEYIQVGCPSCLSRCGRYGCMSNILGNYAGGRCKSKRDPCIMRLFFAETAH